LPRFVVHKHAARALHYDLRLELDNVLKSWAVPKGPPETPGVKRLAVAVDDHALDYIDFKGTIPEGQYGAGTVEIWDKGTFDLTNRTETAISLAFHGEKLEGNYHLIRTKDKNWLIFKTQKSSARSGTFPSVRA
jgi:DNA ligase D-like protein (predicted 3'-phosphoesterase)